MSFPKILALLFATLLSVSSLSAQALEPIVLKGSGERFDMSALNDWRLAVEQGQSSDQELALSFYQMLLSMEFSLDTRRPVLQGRLNSHESRVMVKTLRIALEQIEKSFPTSFSVFRNIALMDRQNALLWSLMCIFREGNSILVKVPNLDKCGEDFGDKKQAAESVLVFHRLAMFLKSFENKEGVQPFLEAYTRTLDGAYSLAFIRKYLVNTRMVNQDDRDMYIGFLGNF